MNTATLELNRSSVDYRRFEFMIGEHRRRAYRMAMQLTRNAAEAEDLMQDTFIKAWKGFDSYVPGRPFLNWLLRIMQRTYLDAKRRDNPIRRADSIHSLVSPHEGDVQELQVVDKSKTPDVELIENDFAMRVRQALNELPPVYREAIELCDLEGLNYSEIADRQGTTIGTVRSRIHRGRKFLREVAIRRGLDRQVLAS
ncbi:MAG TPA: sigma-70 family RNA polymerase sigma factor [Fimbriimonadaceae bacterium]|nr:sigma-70 family RNA polymerase sigma factor [Fimbriimonadaceae bacterium]